MSTPELKDRREAQAYVNLWVSAQRAKVDPMAENHMMRLGAPIELDDIIFLRQFFWPHIDVEAKVSVDDVYEKDAAYNMYMKLDDIPDSYRAPWTRIMSDLSQARALYLSHLRVAEDKVAHATLCFVCPTTIKTEPQLMRDPVMASDGHSYERRNIEKWMREKGEKAKSPMTSDVFAKLPPFSSAVCSNKTLKFAINEAVDRQLLEMMERDPRVKGDFKTARRLLYGFERFVRDWDRDDDPDRWTENLDKDSRPPKRQRET
jgi:hypothetical protein